MTDLVKFEELQADTGLAVRQNSLNILLNNDPKPEWVKQHPMTKMKYLSIGVVEYLLTSIFQKWRVEVKEIKQVANSVVASVRLHYKNPLDGEWDFQDGVGASPLQTDSGAGADFTKVKTAAVQMAAPAAESYAIKDAAAKIGRIFGKDVNRKDEVDYNTLQDFYIDEKKEEAFKLIETCENEADLKNIYNSIGTLKADAEIVAALKAKKESLKANAK